MPATAVGWQLQTERGPDWLLVKVSNPDPQSGDVPPLADQLWSLVECHFVYRMVVDLKDVGPMTSRLVSQLILLQRRIREHGGLLRICGISPHHEELLHACGLTNRLPVYPCREDAVMGHMPTKPR